MPVQRLIPIIEPMISDAFERLSLGDDVIWEITVVPNPQGGGVVPLLIVSLKGVLINSVLQGFAPLLLHNPFAANQEQIDNQVQIILEGLRNARTEQAKMPEGMPPAGQTLNGHR